VWIRVTEERLQREEYGTQGDQRRPLVLEDVEADGAGGRDVRVVDLGDELHLGRFKGKLIGNEDINFEMTTLINTALRTFKGAEKVVGRIVDHLNPVIRGLILIADGDLLVYTICQEHGLGSHSNRHAKKVDTK